MISPLAPLGSPCIETVPAISTSPSSEQGTASRLLRGYGLPLRRVAGRFASVDEADEADRVTFPPEIDFAETFRFHARR